MSNTDTRTNTNPDTDTDTTSQSEEPKGNYGDLIDYPPSLPYDFDTRPHGRMMLRAAVILSFGLALIASALIYGTSSPLLQIWIPSFIALLIILIFAAALYTFRAAGGSYGIIGKEHVTIDPDSLLGLKTRSHCGTFPTSEFAGFALFRLGPQKQMGALHIVNKNPLLRITIAFGAYPSVKRDADFLSKELNLPLHEAEASLTRSAPEPEREQEREHEQEREQERKQ